MSLGQKGSSFAPKQDNRPLVRSMCIISNFSLPILVYCSFLQCIPVLTLNNKCSFDPIFQDQWQIIVRRKGIFAYERYLSIKKGSSHVQGQSRSFSQKMHIDEKKWISHSRNSPRTHSDLTNQKVDHRSHSTAPNMKWSNMLNSFQIIIPFHA